MVMRRTFLAGAGVLAAWPAAAQTTAPPTPTPTPAPLPPPTAGVVRVVLQTRLGRIVLDLQAEKAPITVGNFLRYVDAKAFDGAAFYRAVKVADNPLYGLVQGGLKNNPAKLRKPIAHEPTSKTGLTHLDGAISMARAAPGSATGDFFICVGDASTSLDANPKAEGDNLGFAAFGVVVEGMDVVRKILVAPTSATSGSAAMKGQMLESPVPIISAKRA